MNVVFYSLQGLGNSIINFPILNILRQTHAVKVVSFNNGSSAFFKAFHPSVVGVSSRVELLRQARSLECDAVYTCYPTWKRELSSNLIAKARTKYILGPVGSSWKRWFWNFAEEAKPSLHHLENNLNLLKHVQGITDVEVAAGLDLRGTFKVKGSAREKILGIHPTASSVVKYYPLEFWADLLDSLEGEFEQIHIFCGGNAVEVSYCTSMKAKLGKAVAAKTVVHANLDFQTLLGKIDATSLFIGSDSALMHWAAFLDKNVVGLWSFANYKVIYPYGNHSKVILPVETVASTTYEYPSKPAPYLKRLTARKVVDVIHGREAPNFTIQPKLRDTVKFYEF